MLLEDMVNKHLHKVSESPRLIMETVKPSKSKNARNKVPKKAPVLKSAIFDINVAGADGWADSSFTEFIRSTAYDPALGYPLDTSQTSEINPLTIDTFEDLHRDDNDAEGLGGIGSSGEYSTGEILIE